MITLPPTGVIYGVQAETLAAYVQAERAKVFEVVVEKMRELASNKDGNTEEDWVTLYGWCKTKAAKETV